MMRSREFFCVILMAVALPAWANDAEEAKRLELQRQEAFRAGFATIVEGLNAGSFEPFVQAIDRNDFLDRVFGLRLIDQRLKKGFAEHIELGFEGFIIAGIQGSAETVKATLLGVESRGDRGRAVVRYDLPELQFNYHEYELGLDKKNRIVIIDWTDYLEGQGFTDAVGTSLVMAAPSEAAVRKLIDIQRVKEADLFQLRELLKAARDRQTRRYSVVYAGLDPALRKQRIVVLQNALISKAVGNRRYLREALVEMDLHFPKEPLYTLMLLDFYVPTGQYEKAFAGLQRTYAKLGFDDAAMEARLSAIALAMGNTADANAHAEKAIGLESGLELAWWSALRARVEAGDYAGSVEALQTLEDQHGHTLRAAELGGDKSFAGLLDSTEFQAWAAVRE